jgi:hypothetical protein
MLNVVTLAPMIRYGRLSGCAALDIASEGVVVIDFPHDRN